MTSPASSGPAGSLFEVQVGAYYLLHLLSGSEPRGLPGMIASRVEFQRAGEGHPLDDIIVHAQDAQGKAAVLAIQAGRGITFAPSDEKFKDVVGQIAETSRRPDFWSSHYEVGIATAISNTKINGAYQDVLTWARQLGDAATFHARLQRAGSANEPMRTFVSTFRTNLRNAGVTNDDEIVWALLRRLYILDFDFTAPGSTCEQLVKEIACRVLHPDHASRAEKLWITLYALALQSDASGGDYTRDRLVEELTRKHPFLLAGDRRYFSARTALAEASRMALDDIKNQVGEVKLTRLKHITAVRAALSEGRYVEIRGGGGVGKSGVLRHFAEQIAAKAPVIVLSPGRTTPKGWPAMKAMLGFDGTAHELLVDFAGSGSRILFIDNLDFFEEEEQLTVIDLVREAGKVPGFSVLTTARQDFGVEEPSWWLPEDVLNQLGRAAPVFIDELNEDDIEELRSTAPKLAELLGDNHPARDVARNLFRLDRLANQASNDHIPHTEIDMAEQWWKTADGKKKGRTERSRVLRTLAEHALSNVKAVDVKQHQGQPIDELVDSGTLCDLINGNVTFRHDVLREWAVANLLFTDPAMIERLPFNHTASASLARGVELAARMKLEHSTDSSDWYSFLTTLSGDSTHGSWRRAALLALVHAENGFELLKRASAYLLAGKASLLRELIRTMTSVNVEPITKRLKPLEVDPKIIPANLHVPRGAAWLHLITWLQTLGEVLPVVAIPEVVKVYSAWSTGTFGLDPLTPLLQRQLYYWLSEIETARETDWRHRREPFGGELNRDELHSMESDIRSGFLLFCNRTPELAAQYLKLLPTRLNNDAVVHSVLKMRGALAQAAPGELAEFMAAVLIMKQKPEEQQRYNLNGAFGFIDFEFFPPSPNQGPFLELLTHAPDHGLPLIRWLVDHALSFHSPGNALKNNVIIIPFHDGERAFSWPETYMWSREKGGHKYCVTSGLMALEAWAHRRIEDGEVFDKVLSDVLGPPGAPAAYLLVAVDLLLSHWPKSREAAIPFLACPELLCIDRERLVHDNFDYNGFELATLQKEPPGLASLDSLNKRASRQLTLDCLFVDYAVYGPDKLRNMLTKLLRRAAARLGSPAAQLDLGDPAFMAVYALNLANPDNWKEATITLEDGSLTTALRYLPTQSEAEHLNPLQEAHHEGLKDNNMQWNLYVALDNSSPSSPDFAAAAVVWAQGVAIADNADIYERQMRQEAIFIAATIAARDGSAELRTQHASWIRDTFASAMQTKNDPVCEIRPGLRYNPVAIAFVGMIYLLKDRRTNKDIRTILEVATRDNAAAAHGFTVAAGVLATIDERLPRAVLRCALAAWVQPRRWPGRESKEKIIAHAEQYRRRVSTVIDTEIEWLDGKRNEPEWPKFPMESARPKHRFRMPSGENQYGEPSEDYSRPDEYINHKGAALWIRSAASLYDVTKRPWLRDIARNYCAWTIAANSAELDQDEGVDCPPRKWNEAYYNLLAHCLPGLESAMVDELALTPITSLPEKSFFDILTVFLRSFDEVYFNDHGLQEMEAARIRSILARRMMASHGWSHLTRDRAHNIEVHIGPAIATLFFNDYDLRQVKSYLLKKGMDRFNPFIAALRELIEDCPCLFLALLTLNLVEVSPRLMHLPFIVWAARVWLVGYPDDSAFWVDCGIGRRICAWIEKVLNFDPNVLDGNQALMNDIEHLLAGLVRVGIPEAHCLEETLSKRSNS